MPGWNISYTILENKPLRKNNYNYNEILIPLEYVYMKGSSQSFLLREAAYSAINMIKSNN